MKTLTSQQGQTSTAYHASHTILCETSVVRTWRHPVARKNANTPLRRWFQSLCVGKAELSFTVGAIKNFAPPRGVMP